MPMYLYNVNFDMPKNLQASSLKWVIKKIPCRQKSDRFNFIFHRHLLRPILYFHHRSNIGTAASHITAGDGPHRLWIEGIQNNNHTWIRQYRCHIFFTHGIQNNGDIPLVFPQETENTFLAALPGRKDDLNLPIQGGFFPPPQMICNNKKNYLYKFF
jgi:hypothetical protein